MKGKKTTQKTELRLERVIHGPVEVREAQWEGRSVLVVEGRELHQFLGVGKDFSNWIKDRIKEYDFQENQDFRLLAKFGEQKGKGGHNRKEYQLTLDMAKELSMVERNEKGKQVRRYFIECERQALQRPFARLGHSDPTLERLVGEGILRRKELETAWEGKDPTEPGPRRGALDLLFEDVGLSSAPRFLSALADSAEVAAKLTNNLGIPEERRSVAVVRVLSEIYGPELLERLGLLRETHDGN